MIKLLLVSLAVTSVLCVALGWGCYRLCSTLERKHRFHAELENQWFAERTELNEYLSSVLTVLNTRVGGISKRISESAETAEAILEHAPDLFVKCKGLAYWLHANDQFLCSLHATGARGISRDHQWRVSEMEKAGRSEVFGRIYKNADLDVPLFVSDAAMQDKTSVTA